MRRNLVGWFAGITTALVAGTSAATANNLGIELSLPVDCQIGTECFVQNYVDHDSSTGVEDYRCGGMSYDGHKGTDFRVPTLAEMNKGVNVLAAADGVVKGVRSAMPDISARKVGKGLLKGRECGNGVLLEHPNGWETQYCHMKKGSAVVKAGDKVTAGQALGEIGLSGLTEFPHVHLSVRYKRDHIDPFTNESMKQSCVKSDGSTVFDGLWNAATAKQLSYQRGGFLVGGFLDKTLDLPEVMELGAGKRELPRSAAAIVFWSLAYGLQEGDRVVSRLMSPTGFEMAENFVTLKKNKAQYFLYAGVSRKGMLWEPGVYQGDFSIIRDGMVFEHKVIPLTVK